MGFVRIEGRVNASKHYVCAASPGNPSEFVSPQCVRGVDADSDNIARLNLGRVNRFKGFIDQQRVPKAWRCCGCQNVEPARGNDCSAERNFTWIDEVNAHSLLALLGASLQGCAGDGLSAEIAVSPLYRFSSPNCSYGRKNAMHTPKAVILTSEDKLSLFKSEHS